MSVAVIVLFQGKKVQWNMQTNHGSFVWKNKFVFLREWWCIVHLRSQGKILIGETIAEIRNWFT